MSVSAAEESGGTSVTDASTFWWTNDSATDTETWGAGDAVTVGEFSGEVAVPNGSDPSEFTLVEQVNRTAILRADPDADTETITRAGTEYVVVATGNTTELVAADDYLPAPETRTNEAELSQRSNVTLAGQTYFVYFTGENEVVLESDYSVYAEQAVAMEPYTETRNGLWGVSILPGASAALPVGMGLLPSRY